MKYFYLDKSRPTKGSKILIELDTGDLRLVDFVENHFIDCSSKEIYSSDKVVKFSESLGSSDKSTISNSSEIRIYTDGACSGNPGPGGWGFVVYEDGKEIYTKSSGEKRTTNNRMELIAIIEAVRAIKINGYSKDTILYTDSNYCLNSITKWLSGWKRSNFKNGKLANIDLWKLYIEVSSGVEYQIRKVKAHSGVEGNERADQLAVNSIRELK